jgi:hypothetical protein
MRTGVDGRRWCHRIEVHPLSIAPLAFAPLDVLRAVRAQHLDGSPFGFVVEDADRDHLPASPARACLEALRIAGIAEFAHRAEEGSAESAQGDDTRRERQAYTGDRGRGGQARGGACRGAHARADVRLAGRGIRELIAPGRQAAVLARRVDEELRGICVVEASFDQCPDCFLCRLTHLEPACNDRGHGVLSPCIPSNL